MPSATEFLEEKPSADDFLSTTEKPKADDFLADAPTEREKFTSKEGFVFEGNPKAAESAAPELPATTSPDVGVTDPDADFAAGIGRRVQPAVGTVGKAMHGSGEALKDILAAYAFEAIGEPELQGKQLGIGLEPGEEKPIDQGTKALPTALQVPVKATQGLVQTAPQLAAVATLQAAGVPAPIAAAAVFGTTPEGYDPVQGAIGAALPQVGKYAGALTGAIVRKFGVDGATALNVFKGAGGMTGAAGYLAVIDESAIQNLPPEQRRQARIDMVASLMGQSMLGPMGVEFEGKPSAVEFLEGERKTANDTQSVSEFGGMPEATVPTSGQVVTPSPISERATKVKSVPALQVNAEEIATRPDLMQFKRMDDDTTGVNKSDELQGTWDDLKGGNLLLWEPKDPAAYNLEPGQRYIVANGHHRFEFGDRQDVPQYNSQIIREDPAAENGGYSAQEARALAAEVNIADGKGTVYDQVKFLRNESATHGADEAVARAGRIGIKGRQAATIAFQAGPDLYDSFVNERIKPEQAEAVAKAAPTSVGAKSVEATELKLNEGLQRLGVRKAIDGASATEISNLIQAVRLESRNVPAEQFDLFAADDSALKTAEELASTASRIQGELSREIRATDAAAKNATTAKAKGVTFERPPEEILAENGRLRWERDRWDNWALHPDLVAQVRGYAEMKRVKDGGKPSEQSTTKSFSDSVDGKLKSLKIEMAGKTFDVMQGIPVALWNGSIDTVRLALKAGKALATAIEEGVAWLKAQNLEFDEEKYRARLNREFGFAGQPTRQRAEKVEASDATPAVKRDVRKDLFYAVRTHEQLEQEAREIIGKHGVEGAEKIFLNNPRDLPLDTRSALGAQLQRTFAREEMMARSKGDTRTADSYATRQVQLWRAEGYGTELAQGLAARQLYDKMSPGGMLRHAKEVIGEAGERQWERMKPAVDQVKGAIEEGHRQALEQIRQDPETNGAARAAVDEAVLGSHETHRAVVMELAEPWAQSPTVLQHAREAVHAKANELLNKQPRPPGLTPSQYLRRTLDDLAKRAASIAAAHYQGAEPGGTLKQKFVQRLGLSEEKAGKLALALDAEFVLQVEAAKRKLPKRLANARAKLEQPFNPEDTTDTAVDREIQRQLKLQNQKLGKVLQEQGVAQQTSTGETIADRVVEASGLTGEKAEALREVFERRWNAIATAKKQAMLEQMAKTPAAPTRKVRSAIEKLIALTNLGALEDAKFYDVVKKQLKLPVMTEDLAKEITRRANDLQKYPEGVMRDRSAGDLLNFIQHQNLKVGDVAMGIFYSNVLSGITTPAKIVLENSNLLFGQTLVSFLARPSEWMHPMSFVRSLGAAYGRGLGKGALQAQSTLRTGTVTGVWKEPRTNVMEARPLGKFEPINFWKFFGRAIGTAHEATFKPAWEIKQAQVARDIARKEGLSGGKLQQRVADLLANTDERVDAAKAQAHSELKELGYFQGDKMKPTEWADWRRRVGEILENEREKNMPGSTETAREFALRSAYLNEPYGVLGLIAEGVRGTLERARKEFPVAGSAAKTQVPFTTIVANILNEKMNWTPIGAVRAGVSMKSGKVYGREVMDGDRTELLAKSIVGTALISGLAYGFGQHIHGNGPGDAEKRKQLQAAGWIPHSIEWNGRYYSYMNTPAALGLALVGNYLDWSRYGKGEQADALARTAFIGKATANVIVSQGMLDSLKRFFEAVGSENTSEGANRLERLTARTVTSFVVPNAVQQLDRFWDPTVYDQSDLEGLVKAQVPFVRRDGRPALNVLGEPVQSDPLHYWTNKEVEDPVWKIIAAKQAWVPPVKQEIIVGDRKRGPDFYRALTPDERYLFVKETGERIKARLRYALDGITTVGDKQFLPIPDLDPEQAKKIVQHIAHEERAKWLKSAR